ncbi:MAG: hypothetical protein AAF449_07155 [Myxococcota bacterium]
MLVLDVDDARANDALRTVQTLVERHPKLTAFALFGRFQNNVLTAPTELKTIRADLNARAERLKLSFPLTVLPADLTPGEALHYKPFPNLFDVPRSQTAFLAAADNQIKFAGRLDAQAQNARLKRATEDLL